MAIEVRLPNLGESIAHARLGQWVKRTGERVKRGDVLVEVETDKTSVEIEAPDDGVLSVILINAGTDGVAVGQLLAVLEGDEADGVGASTRASQTVDGLPMAEMRPAVAAANEDEAAAVGSAVAPATGEVLSGVQLREVDVDSAHGGVATGDEHVSATPLARQMAHAAGLSLRELLGSGTGGMITKADIDRVLGPPPSFNAATSRDAVHFIESSQPATASEPSDFLRLSPMRRVTGERLTRSKQQIPHFYLRLDCDVDAVSSLRDDLKARSDATLSFTTFALRAAVLALKKVPAANAVWDGDAIRLFKSVNLAIAVNTSNGLVAPVIRRADEKSIAALNSELRELAERARDGRLRPDEYSGGTCTISNLGMFGIGSLYPIINPPQTCILGIGAVEERPVVRDHQVVARRMMTCTLSADHRALDGATGAALLSAFRGFIEDPWALLM